MSDATMLTEPVNDWLYYRIYFDNSRDIDVLLQQFVSPEVSELRESVNGFRWFFLRFLDPAGFHIRLRIYGNRDDLGRVERRFDHVLSIAQSRVGAAADLNCRQFGKYLYAPEFDKFGTDESMLQAEKIFQAGSELAISREVQAGPDSLIWSAAHMLELTKRLGRDKQLGFLYHYWWYWTGGANANGTVPLVNRMTHATIGEQAQILTAKAQRLLETSQFQEVIEDYSQLCWELINNHVHQVRRSRYYLLFHHLHLMNNRFGIFPHVESAIARHLWHSAYYMECI